MSVILKWSLVLYLASHTWACCTPDQWQGYQPSYGGYAQNQKMGVNKEFSTTFYDFTNKRKAVFMTNVNGDKENRFQVISRCDGDDGCNVYVVDLKKDQCWTKKTAGFRKACIPKDATDNGHGTIGLGKNSMKIVSWLVQKKSTTAYISVGMIGDDRCVAVSETITGMMDRVGFMQFIGFIDFTPGIKNETVFDIPKQCEDNLDSSVEAVFERDHFVMAV